MLPVLVVYYSCTGTARRAAQQLASHRQWAIGEIRDPQPPGVRRCSLEYLLRRRPGFQYDGPPPAGFRAVVVVAPIRAGRLAGPVRSFLRQHAHELEDVALVPIMRSSGATRAFREAAGLLGRDPIACAGFRQREVDDGSAGERLHAFADALDLSADLPREALDSAWTAPA